MVAGAAALQPHVDEPAARVEIHREVEVPLVHIHVCRRASGNAPRHRWKALGRGGHFEYRHAYIPRSGHAVGDGRCEADIEPI